MRMNVQAIICNISFPKTTRELEWFIKENGCFNVEDILYDETVEWTVPQWALPGDIVFFFHAKTAIQIIRKLEIEIDRNRELYDYKILTDGLKRARKLYDLYGGKIFAVGRILGAPFYDKEFNQSELHWRGRVYAEIGDIHIFENPVNINMFSGFIMISRQSSITAVFGENFELLKKLLSEMNKIPDYLIESRANPIPLNTINDENWLELAQQYRCSFFLEIQFRKFYVDYLLKGISDIKKLFSECACFRKGKLVGYADNCICFNGQLCFVEVKLNFDTERNFIEQLLRYCNVEGVMLEKGRKCCENIEQKFVIVIDTRRIGIFNSDSKNITFIANLDSLRTEKDLSALRYAILDFMKRPT